MADDFLGLFGLEKRTQVLGRIFLLADSNTTSLPRATFVGGDIAQRSNALHLREKINEKQKDSSSAPSLGDL